MKTLVITTYPPERCGVASYSYQQVQALAAAGEKVEVLSWGDGAADHKLPQWPTGPRVLDVLPFCRGFDRVIFHYMPKFYLDDSSKVLQIRTRLALHRVFRGSKGISNFEVMVHEQPYYPPVETLSAPGRVLWWLDRRVFAAAGSLNFHNQVAIDTFKQRFRLDGRNCRVAAHGDDFVPFYSGTRAQARRALNLDPNALTFVSVGFISPRKGYELAIEAFRLAPEVKAEYHIVGTPHAASGAEDESYIGALRRQAGSDPRIRFHIDFVDDVAFDCWVRAADAVLIPSRAASSSSVLARCKVMEVPAVTTRQTGLMAELSPRDRAINGAGELADLLRNLAGSGHPSRDNGVVTTASR